MSVSRETISRITDEVLKEAVSASAVACECIVRYLQFLSMTLKPPARQRCDTRDQLRRRS